MKKTYQSPVMNVVKIQMGHVMQTGSPNGVETGGKPGNDFNSNDVTYSRRGSSLWGDDEDEY